MHLQLIFQKMSTSLKKKRKSFDKHGMLAVKNRHGSPLMMQNAASLYCVQAENCPRDRHLPLRQRLRRTVLRAAPQNAGGQSGRLQELNAANLDAHPRSGTSGDGARFGVQRQVKSRRSERFQLSINVGSIV